MKKILTILFSISLLSCSTKEYSENIKTEEALYSMAVVEDDAFISSEHISRSSSYIEDIPKNEKKIIKDGRIGLRVTDLNETKLRIDNLLAKYGAYYANENVSNSDYESSIDLRIRIPNANFEKFIAELESGNGKILYKSIDARDVTSQYIDLDTRIQNKRNYLTKYNDILKQAKSIKDILEVEERIRVLEEEIESTEGQLKYLSNQVAYSTLQISISKEYTEPVKRVKFSENFKHAITKGWLGLVNFILFLFRIWPICLLIIIGIIGFRVIRRRKRKK